MTFPSHSHHSTLSTYSKYQKGFEVTPHCITFPHFVVQSNPYSLVLFRHKGKQIDRPLKFHSTTPIRLVENLGANTLSIHQMCFYPAKHIRCLIRRHALPTNDAVGVPPISYSFLGAVSPTITGPRSLVRPSNHNCSSITKACEKLLEKLQLSQIQAEWCKTAIRMIAP